MSDKFKKAAGKIVSYIPRVVATAVGLGALLATGFSSVEIFNQASIGAEITIPIITATGSITYLAAGIAPKQSLKLLGLG